MIFLGINENPESSRRVLRNASRGELLRALFRAFYPAGPEMKKNFSPSR